MNDKFRKLAITFSILLLGSFAVWSLSHFGAVSASVGGARHAVVEPIKEIAGYRNWTKVNVDRNSCGRERRCAQPHGFFRRLE
jgi:hypothetical protein